MRKKLEELRDGKTENVFQSIPASLFSCLFLNLQSYVLEVALLLVSPPLKTLSNG